MKKLKFILFICVSATILSCGDDNSGSVAYTLTNANIAGTYKITSFEGKENETATSSSGAVVNLSNSTIIGDTFQIDLIINANSTYTVSGLYREVKTITPNGAASSESKIIFNIDSAGNYQINSTDNTITFNPSSGEFLDGGYNINAFSETLLSVSNKTEEMSGSNTISKTLNIGFTKQ